MNRILDTMSAEILEYLDAANTPSRENYLSLSAYGEGINKMMLYKA